MNPQPLSKNYRSGVKDEFDLTGSNSNRYRESRRVQNLKQVEKLPHSNRYRESRWVQNLNKLKNFH